jgi:hypothetical protein
MGRIMQVSIDFEYVDKFGCPQIAVLVDDQVLYSGNVQRNVTVNCSIKDGRHHLKIVHSEKKIDDYDDLHDRHVVIKKIMFDGVDLDQTMYCPLTHRGRFYPEYEESYIVTCKEQGVELPEYISPNHYLGHNGTWILAFESPAYTWIIQEQKPSGINLEDTIFSTGNETLNEVKSFFNV